MKVAAYSGSRNLYPQMTVALKSLLMNSDIEKVYLLIEDDDYPIMLPKNVETINASKIYKTFFDPDGPNMSSPYTYFAMIRAALSFIIPYDKVLSLDVDTIVDKDIWDLWDCTYVEDSYFAAAKEDQRSYVDLLYTNTGVCLYNLKKLRDGKAQEVIDVLNSTRFNWLEQDVFNYLCQGRIAEMDSCYNVNDWTHPTYERKIIHYAGYPDWTNFPEYKKYEKIPIWRI